MRRRLLRWVLLPGAAVILGTQLVPYGWSHENPPVRLDAPWPSARAEQLARTACYGCHSNETDWPPYSYVAPMSWLVRQDVENGRERLNFSLWDRDGDEADEAIESIEDRSMPPDRYTLLHPSARLSATEKAELIAALQAMGGDGGRGRGGDQGDRRGPDRGPGRAR